MSIYCGLYKVSSESSIAWERSIECGKCFYLAFVNKPTRGPRRLAARWLSNVCSNINIDVMKLESIKSAGNVVISEQSLLKNWNFTQLNNNYKQYDNISVVTPPWPGGQKQHTLRRNSEKTHRAANGRWIRAIHVCESLSRAWTFASKIKQHSRQTTSKRSVSRIGSERGGGAKGVAVEWWKHVLACTAHSVSAIF